MTDQLALIEVTFGRGEPLTPPRSLPVPSKALAADLLVEHGWLAEVAAVLAERHQVIFYGPPGTSKTFIARKLAAGLVGEEQVKLVQFHPA